MARKISKAASPQARQGQEGPPLKPTPVTQYDRPNPPISQYEQVLNFGLSGLVRSGGYILEEFLKELQGQRGYKLLREMRDNDPTIGAMLYMLEQMSKQVDWNIMPYGGDNATPEDEKRAEYVRSCMFDDMDKTWPETLSEISSMYWAGFAPMEVCYKVRRGEQTDASVASSSFNDGLWGWDHWGVRAQETVLYWQFDARNKWQALAQQAPPDYLLRIVPREKVLLFRVKSDRDNPEGRSLLRNAYPSYMRKRRLEAIEAIGIERRISGFPVITPPDGVDLWNTNDPNAATKLTALQKLVRNVRMDDQMGMVKPFGYTFELVSTSGGSAAMDTNAIIGRYDHRMAMTIGMDFLFLGSGGNGGARAQASVDVEMFNTAFEGILEGITEVPNRFAIPKLCKFNGWKDGRYPKLVHGDVSSPNLAALGMFITNLAQAGMQLFPDADLEHSLRAMGGLPEPVGGVQKRKALAKRGRYGKQILRHVETNDAKMVQAVERLMAVCDKIEKSA